MGYETIASMTRCNSPSTKAPTGKTLNFLVITCTPCHLIHLHDLDQTPPGKYPKLKGNYPNMTP